MARSLPNIRGITISNQPLNERAKQAPEWKIGSSWYNGIAPFSEIWSVSGANILEPGPLCIPFSCSVYKIPYHVVFVNTFSVFDKNIFEEVKFLGEGGHSVLSYAQKYQERTVIFLPDFGNDVSFVRGNSLFRLRAAAVILRGDSVLMMGNDTVPYLYSIGGAVHLGETTEDAVRREVLEETGLQLSVDRLLAVHQNFFVDKDLGGEAWHELAFYYLMKAPDTLPDVDTHSDSMIGAKEHSIWVPLDRFGEYNAYPRFFKDMEALLASPAPVFITSRE